MSDRFDTIGDAIAWLTDSTDYERMRRVRYNADTFSLDRMNRLAEALGRPQRRFRSVHIAGTKGKGSTAAMVEAILRHHGQKTGLYTSPHLVDMRERIQIDRQWIDEDLMRRMVGRVADAVDAHLADDCPTYFEMMTAVAFCAFAEAGVETAVLEVGLGGRLDATNIVTPEVTIITPVSIDHTHQLGSDLATIAGEKAGIIKPSVPVVLAPQPPEADAAIRRRADALNASLLPVAGLSLTWKPIRVEGRPAGRITLGDFGPEYHRLVIPLPGRVQATNALCAIVACDWVLGDVMCCRTVREALAALQWPGRMQTFPGKPTVILDGAHNADSLRQLLASAKDYYPNISPVVVFASAADKDIDGMMTVLAESGAGVVFTRTDNPRAALPSELAEAFRAAHGTAIAASDRLSDALVTARTTAGPDGLVLVCGSLYLVGELLADLGACGLAELDVD